MLEQNSPLPFLTLSDQGQEQVVIDKDLFNLGQGSFNQLILNHDDKISSRHARIEKKGDSFIIRDLRSEGGTYVNGTRVIEAHLQHGDVIGIGQKQLSFSTKPLPVCQLSSHNKKWQEQLKDLPQLADNDLSVLLLGPSGTGKDVIANELHRLSSRQKGPLVSVNCCALSESLIESELFGHVKGSFTGAIGDRKGAFESARCGTLFLDEIGDLSPGLQAKLLRALENCEIKPVGSDRSIKTDVRIIAATHQNLQQKVQQGLFRGDLYYRLCVLQITPPSLAERMEDFETLLFHFSKEKQTCFSYDAVEELKKHSWPGNIRELRNTVLRASALYKNQRIQKTQARSLIDKCMMDNQDHFNMEEQAKDPSLPLLKQVEKSMIVKFLKANRGNQRKTASALGLPKSTLNDRIKSYQINIDDLFPGLPMGSASI